VQNVIVQDPAPKARRILRGDRPPRADEGGDDAHDEDGENEADLSHMGGLYVQVTGASHVRWLATGACENAPMAAARTAEALAGRELPEYRGESPTVWARVFLPAGLIVHRQFGRQAEIPSPRRILHIEPSDFDGGRPPCAPPTGSRGDPVGQTCIVREHDGPCCGPSQHEYC